jgi:hypothetical protein
MYVDSRNNRTLLRDGTSIVTPFEYARMIIQRKDINGVKAVDSFDSRLYEFRSGVNISGELIDVHVSPAAVSESVDYFEWILAIIQKSDRFSGAGEEVERILEEVEFFSKHNHLPFLKKVYELIQRFKHENVLWGVGRGSSCASYVLFLLEIHDVNALRYKIPFSELSKEVVRD